MREQTPDLPLFPALLLFAILGLLTFGLLAGQPRIPPAPPTATVTAVASVPTATTPQQAEAVAYTDQEVADGHTLFEGTCAACHGQDAHGIPGLGKNLAASTFVHGLSDDDLLHFITVGRPVTDPMNTTGVMMPPRGGNPSLTDDQLRQVAAAPTPATIATLAPYTLPIAGMDFTHFTVPTRPFDPAAAYAVSCSGCHGEKGEGGSAPALATTSLSDDAIFSLLTNNQPPINPNTAFPHPLRGDYPELSDDQLHALIQYLHTLSAS